MKIRKLINLLLIIMIGATLFACTKKEEAQEICIVFTSDVHCGVDMNFTFASLKAYVEDLKEEHENVLLVDCGDYLQGGTIGSLSKGELVVKLMNDMEYDIVTFGNHEFDYGVERLHELMGEMNFEKIASNVRYSGSKENIFADIPEYIIKDFKGTKVAFLGLLTPDSVTSSTPKFFMEDDELVYNFYSGNDGQDFYDKVQSLVDEVRSQGADYVVALSHLGSEITGAPYDSLSMISHTNGIDVVFDGHSHSLITEDLYPNKDGEDVILSSVGTQLQEVGTLFIDKEGNMQIVHLTEYDRQDEKLTQSVADVYEQLNTILSQKAGEIDYDLKITDEEGIRMVRARETNMGDLTCDAYRYVMGTDIAVINGGGVRADIKAGEVLYQDLFNVTPYQNNIASIYASGQQIMDALEFAYRYTEGIYKLDGNAVGESGAFLQISGLKCTIDTSIQADIMVDENSMFTGVGERRRVKDVMVLENGEYVPIDPNKIYTVASTDYVLLNAGDGNTAFKDCEIISAAEMVDVEALWKYFTEVDFGDKYRESDDRIKIE
ncbi:MAG: bifunctional metallophosphatase/5'-nucleotidase [Erysipelotrichaceae bacterium]|nr:bifunctional metallophosphatase/5'-nucleotidase [Erysipelotrichaceae bacterium]